jgi:hypothetical protein
MILAEQKLNSFRKVKNHDLYPIEQKYIPTISKVIHFNYIIKIQ